MLWRNRVYVRGKLGEAQMRSSGAFGRAMEAAGSRREQEAIRQRAGALAGR